jgi:hypothetical protein
MRSRIVVVAALVCAVSFPLMLTSSQPVSAIGKLAPGERRCFGVAGVPGDVAVVNLTPVQAEGIGFGRLVSSDVADPPVFSNVNFRPGTIDPNVAMAQIGGDGRVCFVNSLDTSVHVVADHLGTIDAAGYAPATATGAPARTIDTRTETPAPPPPPPSTSLPGDGSARFVGGVSQRVLVDQFGDALFLVADAGWSLIGALDRSEIVAYLDLVVERGHNGVLVNLIEAGFSDQPPLAGEPGVGGPFTGGLFTSAPNEVYWAHVDWVIAEMAARGLTAVANPAYAGFVDEHGVGAEMKAASDGQMEAFGRFIGGRYADVPNVVYQIGGDTTFDPASDLGRRYAAMANGIVAADATKVMTVMTGPDRWSSAMWDPGWLDFEAVYENDSADLSWLDLWGSTSRPLVYAEPSYEGSRFVDAGWSRWYGRRVLYVSFGFGYTGVIPGNCLRWHFGEDPLGVGCSSWGSASWADTLVDRSGVRGPDGGPADRHAHDTQRFVELVEGLPWPSMVPDTGGVFLTQGRGDGVDRASARVGGGVGYVYVPSARDVTVATTTVGGVVSLRWHDPTTGEVVVISTSETAVNSRVVSHPGPNSAGDNDWVLLVTAV